MPIAGRDRRDPDEDPPHCDVRIRRPGEQASKSSYSVDDKPRLYCDNSVAPFCLNMKHSPQATMAVHPSSGDTGLAPAHEYLAAIVESSDDAIISKDLNG